MINVGIIDADLIDGGTNFPNLALMKISAFNKEIGNNVELLNSYKDIDNYDKVYISKVFNFTKVPKEIFDKKNVQLGGTGFYFENAPSLEYYCEHHMPDYHLYDNYVASQIERGKDPKKFLYYQKCSIGFLTRGCFRKCDFCVNKKYDTPLFHSKISEFLDKTRPFICLLDDNVLAYKNWEQIIDSLIETQKPFQFRQGLDIRLLTHKKAKKLSEIKYHGDFIFAFDNIKDKNLVEKNLKLWRQYCKKTTKLYLLCGYFSQDLQDIIDTFERIKILMKYSCNPYIMRYEAYKDSEFKNIYIQLARWCNQPQFYKKMSFREFCEANQFYHKNKNTMCLAYKSMIDFEFVYPEIAREYFDLKYENLKIKNTFLQTI